MEHPFDGSLVRGRLLADFRRAWLILVVVQHAPLDTGVFDADVLASQLIESLEQRGALFRGDGFGRRAGFEFRRLIGCQFGQLRCRVRFCRDRRGGFFLGQMLQRVERMPAAAAAYFACRLLEDFRCYAKSDAAFRALGVHRSALDPSTGQSCPLLPALRPVDGNIERDPGRVSCKHFVDLLGEYAGKG